MLKPKRLPGDPSPTKQLAETIRVDLAGEYGACHIYQGQLKYCQNHEIRHLLEHMLEQEKRHLAYFAEQIPLRRIRPSFLSPLWGLGGYLLGALTARLGKNEMMICTEAVEEVIDEHYASQLIPPHEIELKNKIELFRQEEIEHRNIAQHSHDCDHNSLLAHIIQSISKISIQIAKKI